MKWITRQWSLTSSRGQPLSPWLRAKYRAAPGVHWEGSVMKPCWLTSTGVSCTVATASDVRCTFLSWTVACLAIASPLLAISDPLSLFSTTHPLRILVTTPTAEHEPDCQPHGDGDGKGHRAVERSFGLSHGSEIVHCPDLLHV